MATRGIDGPRAVRGAKPGVLALVEPPHPFVESQAFGDEGPFLQHDKSHRRCIGNIGDIVGDHRVVAFQRDEDGDVALAFGRQAVGEDHGEPAVADAEQILLVGGCGKAGMCKPAQVALPRRDAAEQAERQVEDGAALVLLAVAGQVPGIELDLRAADARGRLCDIGDAARGEGRRRQFVFVEQQQRHPGVGRGLVAADAGVEPPLPRQRLPAEDDMGHRVVVGPVLVGRGKTAVDLVGRKDEARALDVEDPGRELLDGLLAAGLGLDQQGLGRGQDILPGGQLGDEGVDKGEVGGGVHAQAPCSGAGRSPIGTSAGVACQMSGTFLPSVGAGAAKPKAPSAAATAGSGALKPAWKRAARRSGSI